MRIFRRSLVAAGLAGALLVSGAAGPSRAAGPYTVHTGVLGSTFNMVDTVFRANGCNPSSITDINGLDAYIISTGPFMQAGRVVLTKTSSSVAGGFGPYQTVYNSRCVATTVPTQPAGPNAVWVALAPGSTWIAVSGHAINGGAVELSFTAN